MTLKKPLIHHGIDESKVAELTKNERWIDPRTSHWSSTTQVWSWEGGDAIVVLTGCIGEAMNYVVMRLGDKVHLVAGTGLAGAMRAFGIDLNDYFITIRRDFEEVC